jgi:hypothetical protein
MQASVSRLQRTAIQLKIDLRFLLCEPIAPKKLGTHALSKGRPSERRGKVQVRIRGLVV